MDCVERYEKNKNWNSIVRWIHAFRYRTLLANLATVAGDPLRILDIGCGPAPLYKALDFIRPIEYFGIDQHPEFCAVASRRYGDRRNFHLLAGEALELIDQVPPVDVIVAIETLEHMHEREVAPLIEKVAAMRPRYFACSVPIEIGPALWLKNVGSALFGYPRHKEYTWYETFWAGCYALDRLPLHRRHHRVSTGAGWRKWCATA